VWRPDPYVSLKLTFHHRPAKTLLNWLTVCFYKIFKPELWRLQWENTLRKLVKIRLRSVEATYQWSAAIT